MEKSLRKKVLLILSHTGSGGDTQAILNLLAALPDHSIDFHILSYQRGTTHTSFKNFGAVYVFPLDKIAWIRRALRRFTLPLFILLKKCFCHYLIKKIQPDLIYLNTVNEHEFSQAALYSNRKLIVHIHEMGFVVTQRMRSEWVKALLTIAHSVVCPAQAVLEFYRDVYAIAPEKMTVIYETASESRFQPSTSALNMRHTLNVPAHTLLIGSAGSVIYRKGVDTFIKACSIVKQKLPDLSLLFLWQGGQTLDPEKHPYWDALVKSVQRENLTDYFHFLPYTPQVDDFYTQLDIFVLPSRMEAFPLVLLEAMLKEKPVVAMDVAGVREVVDDHTGYLVKDRTPEGLAEGIMYFLEDEKRRQKAGKAGRQRVLENFEARVQIPIWMDLLATV